MRIIPAFTPLAAGPSANVPTTSVPRAQPEQGGMVRMSDDHGRRQHRPRSSERYVKALDHGREHQAGLGQRQLRADADARAGAKRHIGEAVRKRAIAQEP